MERPLTESQSLDWATRPRRRSTPSVTVTFSGSAKSGTTSLIYRLAYDRWRKGDASATSVPDPIFFRVDERIDVLLEDVTHMETVYPAMRHSSVSNSIVRVFVFSLDDHELDKHFSSTLARVCEDQELMNVAALYHLARRSLFVFTKNDKTTDRETNLWACQAALSQVGAVALLPEDTQPKAPTANILYTDCSSLSGEGVGLLRAFLRQAALDTQTIMHDNDISPRYVLSSHEIGPESAAPHGSRVSSFRSDGNLHGCVLL